MEREYREHLLEIHARNLRLLLEQAARFGREYSPAHLVGQIEDEVGKIEGLCRELETALPDELAIAHRMLGRSAGAHAEQIQHRRVGRQPNFERISPDARSLNMKILALFANPRGTSSLRLGEEDRMLRACIRQSKNRDMIQLDTRHAVTIDDVRKALLDGTYDVVHFSGHGTGTGLALEDPAGRLYVPPADAVAELLGEFSPPLSCVVLNACYSTTQGSLTSMGLPFTIAMEGPIADDAAIVFTGGFYDSLAAGRDVEFSFRQGVLALKLASHPDKVVPKLIRQGETIQSRPHASRPSVPARERNRNTAHNLLVGFAVDVSGSMESSINNKVGTKQSRLSAFRDALNNGVERSKEFLSTIQGTEVSARFFAYAFGLRTDTVCDLFSLVKAADGLISKTEIEKLKERYASEIRGKYARSAGGGLESLARQYLGSSTVESLKSTLQSQAEKEVRERIMMEVREKLVEKLEKIGEMTLTVDEFLDLWKNSDQALTDAEGLIFGNTPMREALTRVNKRFEKELSVKSPEKVTPILLLISDGESTDGDPTVLATQARNMGVTVIGCYVTDNDLFEPRVLQNTESATWPKGAADMFAMSSTIPEDSDFNRYLLSEGWHVPKGAKAFVQVNHSEVLEELVGLALSPIQGQSLLPKGR